MKRDSIPQYLLSEKEYFYSMKKDNLLRPQKRKDITIEVVFKGGKEKNIIFTKFKIIA